MDTQRSPMALRPSHFLLTLLALLVCFVAMAPHANAQDTTSVDGPIYSVDAFELRYLKSNPLLPAVDTLAAAPIALGRLESGYVVPREGIEIVATSIGEINRAGAAAPFHASALQHILATVRDELLARDMFGINCFPDPIQINRDGVDLRGDDESSLTLIIATGIVTEMRTVAGGDRVTEGGDIEPEDRINHPLHRRYIDDSPVRPFAADDEGARRDLLHKSEIDRYLFFLGRHPGRLVDLTVAAAQEVGAAAVDFRITENKPLVLYAQVSNTGTRDTSYWRERFGLMHTQLTENDDILSIEYTTAQFDQVHGLFASYEAPFANERLRWQVLAGWSEYTASDIGIFGDSFNGESFNLSARLIWNFYQNRELFIDAFAGVRYDDLRVNNPNFFIEGEETLVTPFIGVRLDRTTGWFSTQASVNLDFQPDITGVDRGELTALGRTLPDETWTVLRWNAMHSFYIEPAIDRAGWEDPSTPESSTLAHELLFKTRGQWAFGSRVIPQEQQVAGGLYSVRGYPQSIVAADNVFMATAEYRYHIPRAFTVQPKPREMFGEPFRAAPQFVYGTPDWDLVAKAFVDMAWTDNNDALSFEGGETLIGAGIGVDFLYRRNVNISIDWGFVLEELDDRGVNSGSNRLHVVATILF